jgi:hypothetical protein
MVYSTDVGYVHTPIPNRYESLSATSPTVLVAKGDHTQDIKLTNQP